MTNRDRLNTYTDREFAEYIWSVYLAGKMYKDKNLDTVDYEKWLNDEVIE